MTMYMAMALQKIAAKFTGATNTSSQAAIRPGTSQML